MNKPSHFHPPEEASTNQQESRLTQPSDLKTVKNFRRKQLTRKSNKEVISDHNIGDFVEDSDSKSTMQQTAINWIKNKDIVEKFEDEKELVVNDVQQYVRLKKRSK